MRISLLAFILIITSAADSFSQTDSTVKFKPSGKVWGYVFGDYYYKFEADSLGRGGKQYSNQPKDMNGFDLRRVYLGYDFNISEKFSTELLLSHEGNLDASGNRAVFIKAANVQWKNFLPNTTLIVGQQSAPAFSLVSEKIWGYRSIEKTILDMQKLASSNDLGIGLRGKFISNESSEVGYNLLLSNGTGSKPEVDRFKKFGGELYAKILGQKLIVDVYSDYERVQLSPFHKSKNTYKVFLGYSTDLISVGAEAVAQVQENYAVFTSSATPPQKDTTDAIAVGVSGIVRGYILKDKLNYFARYDMFNPDKDFNADNSYATSYTGVVTESFITAGVDYMPVKNVHIMPNVWYNAYDSRLKNVKGNLKEGKDIVGRLTFYYIFK
jgi:hypothetical protein